MYLKGTKCQLFVLSCLLPATLLAKEVKSLRVPGKERPLCFIENKGQVTDGKSHVRTDVQFKLNSNGLNLFVGDAQLHYQFRDVQFGAQHPDVKTYGMDVTLLGADRNAKVQATDMLDYYENYYPAGSEGFTAHAYRKITYTNVYPAIDWVVYVKDGSVEYDFVVKPGGDPSRIKLKYTGATRLSLSRNGGIIAHTPMGDVQEKQPVAFETSTGKKVNSRFVVHDNVVSFETGSYNGGLTIDPYLSWSTYHGGSNDDVITSVTVASGGATYAVGYTASSDLPTTSAYQAANGGGTYDIFLVKYSSAGTRQFATYFGGTGNDQGMAISAESTGNAVFITGNTTSNGLATFGAHHNANGGATDMFLARFSSTGARTWFTYIGGTGLDNATGVACDGAGAVYVGGFTESSTAISTNGTTLSGSRDGYLGKFTQGGPTRISATYFGGSSVDEVHAVATDAGNNVVATGVTSSSTGIATAGASQALLDGSSDAFVARFNSAVALQFGTYLGGSGDEDGLGIACDAALNIYVTGNTTSTDSIAAGYAHRATFGGGAQDAFLHKYASTGFLNWGTYAGGNAIDYGRSVAVDMFGNIVIGGATNSSGMASAGAFQASIAGSFDGFVGKYNNAGQNFYTTYYGQSNLDYAYGISTDPGNSSVVLAGSTRSTGMATSGAAQASYTSGQDGFVTRFAEDTLVFFRPGTWIDTLVCAGGTLIINDTTIFNFNTGNTFTVQLSNASGSFASPVTIGSSATTSAGAITCTIPAGTTPGTGYRIRIVASSPAFTSPDNMANITVVNGLTPPTVTGTSPVCNGIGQTIYFGVSAPYQLLTYNWSGPSAFSSTLQNPSVASATTANAGTYSVTTTHNGCPALTSTVTVVVSTFFPPAPSDSSNSPVCSGSTLRLFGNPNMAGTFSYYWTGPGGFTSNVQNPTIAGIGLAGSGTYTLVDTFDACPSPATSITVTVLPLDTPNITIAVAPNDTVCKGTMVNFTSTYTYAGYSPTFQWLYSATAPAVGAIYDHWSTPFFSLGTAVRCVMTSSLACPDKPRDTSNIIYMTVLDNTPVVTITATPDSFIGYGGTVTFHAVVAGYSLIADQWYVNNVPVLDSSTTLVLSGITHNDTVRYEVVSSDICASIGVSNTVIVRLTNSVTDVTPSLLNVDLYPNPNTGNFSIKGAVAGLNDGNVAIEITNALGQVVTTGQVAVKSGNMDSAVSVNGVAPGMYLLRLSKDGLSKTFKFVIE